MSTPDHFNDKVNGNIHGLKTFLKHTLLTVLRHFCTGTGVLQQEMFPRQRHPAQRSLWHHGWGGRWHQEHHRHLGTTWLHGQATAVDRVERQRRRLTLWVRVSFGVDIQGGYSGCACVRVCLSRSLCA